MLHWKKRGNESEQAGEYETQSKERGKVAFLQQPQMVWVLQSQEMKKRPVKSGRKRLWWRNLQWHNHVIEEEVVFNRCEWCGLLELLVWTKGFYHSVCHPLSSYPVISQLQHIITTSHFLASHSHSAVTRSNPCSHRGCLANCFSSKAPHDLWLDIAHTQYVCLSPPLYLSSL